MTPEERLAVLREIMTDIVNQLEVTPGGYYIYRFNLATMRRIADALNIDNAEREPLATYLPDQLSLLIRQD